MSFQLEVAVLNFFTLGWHPLTLLAIHTIDKERLHMRKSGSLAYLLGSGNFEGRRLVVPKFQQSRFQSVVATRDL